ncbi:MAG: hypothetical protein K8T89_16215, partial [Planctomycetes bacterium]|nr:hypothetical protein [Planctomycetota bacterium]
HRRFKNRTWEIDLKVERPEKKPPFLKGELKNISSRLQVLGNGNVMKLNVWLSPDAAEPFPFIIEGDSVDAGGTLAIKTIEKHNISVDYTIKELARVEQVFDTRTIPVKRVENFTLGYKSDRNFSQPLKMAKFSEALIPKDAMPEENDTTSVQNFSQNKLARRRYLDVTDQVRRMPLSLVLLTDQAYMKDILEALVNIELRFQTTQVHWNRFHGTLNYGVNQAGATSPSNNREDQFSANLLEVSIYGIVSFFERVPDDAKVKDKK